jgi:Family of unknown function (DUF5681)
MARARKIRAKGPNPRYRHLKPFQFNRGQSGNPKGRPPGSRSKVSHELAMDKLVAIMQSKRTPAAAQVKAAKIILDLAWGRPTCRLLMTIRCPRPRSPLPSSSTATTASACIATIF